jgi:cytochrome b
MSTKYVWDRFVRLFHWSLVTAFAVAFATYASEWDRLLHAYAGYAAGLLILARICWGNMRTGYANFHAFPLHPIEAARYIWQILHGQGKRFIGHNPAGSLMIYALLADGLFTVLTGILVYNDGWLIDRSELLQTLHAWSSWTWLALVGLHVAGVLIESILHHDNLIGAMITGFKRRSKKSELPDHMFHVKHRMRHRH